ncbi:MAG: FGGY family carbohydrate kinase [Oscillospiraceae bacterium]|nr:FGGY family carbohydrate kinase [Oscillospiraceae bacterium]
MYAIGIDIGTTTISAVALDCDGAGIVETVTLPNTGGVLGGTAGGTASGVLSRAADGAAGGVLGGAADGAVGGAAFCPYESVQDPGAILGIVVSVIEKFCGKYSPIKTIGLSCQMHGIVYIDKRGAAVSPLYTWQDKRGDEPAPGGGSYVQLLEKLTGYGDLATGYGAVTHFYNMQNRLVPDGAASLCTIGDYVAMKLTGGTRCATHASNAASIALYTLGGEHFDGSAIKKAGMEPAFFPAVETGCALFGETRGIVYGDGGGVITDKICAGVPVSFCIGDNQASFLGAVAEPDASVLINVGTGGQISVCGDNLAGGHLLEVRPLSGARCLQVGATLCAGSAYAALEKFYASVLHMAGVAAPGPLYDAMGRSLNCAGSGITGTGTAGDGTISKGDNGNNAIGTGASDIEPLIVAPLFSGTRRSPGVRGSITNISLANFTPERLTSGVLDGIAEEFYELYRHMDGASTGARSLLIGAGNGLRKNAYLRRTLTKRFGMPMLVPKNTEEAAVGCALYALTACGHYADLTDAQSAIQYEEVETQ